MFVRDVMTRDVVTLPEEMPFKKNLETVSCSRHLYYPVVSAMYNREILLFTL